MTDDLVAFLRARLDELADAAREEIEYRKSLPDLTGATVVFPPLMWVGWDDPTFVLAEVEAKRQILQIHRPARFTNADLGIHDVEVCLTCHSHLDQPDDWPDGEDWSYPLVQDRYPCSTVRYLALPYAGHADYRQEWAQPAR